MAHFHLGELVRVSEHAREPFPAGEVGTLTAITLINTAELVFRYGLPFGTTAYSVAFANGSEHHLPADLLEPWDPQPAGGTAR